MLQATSSIVSSNFDSRLLGSHIEYIILHYTACGFDLSVDILTDAASQNPVSAHYLIDEHGEVFQLVDDDKRAWHAGVSCWLGKEGLNTWSLGIEMVYPGHGPFAQAQLQSCLKLCQALMHKYKIPPENILGHSDVAPDRKADPGENFDWKGFADNGVGLYSDTLEPSLAETEAARVGDVSYVQCLLHNFGYKITRDGVQGVQTQAVIRAFQRRFSPEKVDGEMDTQGLARLQVLLNV